MFGRGVVTFRPGANGSVALSPCRRWSQLLPSSSGKERRRASGALSDVEYDVLVTDTTTGQSKTYHNPAGTLASVADTKAF